MPRRSTEENTNKIGRKGVEGATYIVSFLPSQV